jgi:signal transduction histidine kinase
VAEISVLLGFDPRIRFAGPIDAVVPDPVADDLVAVLREGLTNVARHAQAARVQVDVTVTATRLSLDISDDGVGIGDTQRRSGLANLRERAERRGGRLVLAEGPDDATPSELEGTRLQWMIPLI